MTSSPPSLSKDQLIKELLDFSFMPLGPVVRKYSIDTSGWGDECYTKWFQTQSIQTLEEIKQTAIKEDKKQFLEEEEYRRRHGIQSLVLLRDQLIKELLENPWCILDPATRKYSINNDYKTHYENLTKEFYTNWFQTQSITTLQEIRQAAIEETKRTQEEYGRGPRITQA